MGRETVNANELTQQILQVLVEVAPDVDTGALDPDKSFRDQFEIDSLDFLNFVLTLQEKLGVKIAEADYPKLSSLGGSVAYLSARLAS
jgi:acyl carrier protein